MVQMHSFIFVSKQVLSWRHWMSTAAHFLHSLLHSQPRLLLTAHQVGVGTSHGPSNGVEGETRGLGRELVNSR